MVRPLHRVLFFCLTLTVLAAVFTCAHVQGMQDAISQQVLRLHIVANSDSDFDQGIKLKVRNRILTDCGYLFSHCRTAQESAAVARQNTALLRRTAEDELRRQGVLQPVAVQVGACAFPTKEYGGVRLPAGNYTAVNIRIGTAGGKNWWCVMYPPLCLTGDAVKADADTLALLRQQLTAEEYALVTESQDIQVNVKFKLAEVLGRWF
ncbi:MAG: stage II sporulation protein R [Clostridia bacterium]|nr:stage II sporulation protein R [Clostridia bacterium]